MKFSNMLSEVWRTVLFRPRDRSSSSVDYTLPHPDFKQYDDPHYEPPSSKSTAPSSPNWTWTPSSHEPVDIKKRLHGRIQALENPHRPAIQLWENHMKNCDAINDPCKNGPDQFETEKAAVASFVPVFDEIIFKDAFKSSGLSSNLDVHFVSRDEELWKENNVEKDTLGYTESRNGKAYITIFELAGRHSAGNGRRRMFSYLGTLLHEMLHALIRLYLCTCSRCRTDDRYIRGLTGHGNLWALLAQCVEYIAQDCLGLKNLNLGRHSGIASELRNQGRELKQKNWSEFGLSGKEDADMVSLIMMKNARGRKRKR